jgi:hypothetical protein
MRDGNENRLEKAVTSGRFLPQGPRMRKRGKIPKSRRKQASGRLKVPPVGLVRGLLRFPIALWAQRLDRKTRRTDV